MNRDKNEVFSEAIFAFQLGIPWIFNPSKLDWTYEDTNDLRKALTEAGILDHAVPRTGFVSKNNTTYIIGVEDPKTITYLPFHGQQSIVGSRPFPQVDINLKIIGDKTHNPLEKTKPKLP